MPRRRINPLDSSFEQPLRSIGQFLAGNEVQEFTVLIRNFNWDILDDKQANTTFTNRLEELVKQGQNLVLAKQQEIVSQEAENEAKESQISVGIQADLVPPCVQQKAQEQSQVAVKEQKQVVGFELFEKLAAMQPVSKRIGCKPFQFPKKAPSLCNSKPISTKSPTLAVHSTNTTSQSGSAQQQCQNQICLPELDKQSDCNQLIQQMSGLQHMDTIQEEYVGGLQQKSAIQCIPSSKDQQQEQKPVQLLVPHISQFKEKQTSNVENQSVVKTQQIRLKSGDVNVKKQSKIFSLSTQQFRQDENQQQSQRASDNENSVGALNICNIKQRSQGQTIVQSSVGFSLQKTDTVIVGQQFDEQVDAGNNSNNTINKKIVLCQDAVKNFGSNAVTVFQLNTSKIEIGKTQVIQDFSTPQKTNIVQDDVVPDTEVLIPQTMVVDETGVGQCGTEEDEFMVDVCAAQHLRFSSEEYSFQKSLQNKELDDSKVMDEVTSGQQLTPIAESEIQLSAKSDHRQDHNSVQTTPRLQLEQHLQKQLQLTSKQKQQKEEEKQTNTEAQQQDLIEHKQGLQFAGNNKEVQNRDEDKSEVLQEVQNEDKSEILQEVQNKHTLEKQHSLRSQQLQSIQSLQFSKNQSFTNTSEQKQIYLCRQASNQQNQQTVIKKCETEIDKSKFAGVLVDNELKKSLLSPKQGGSTQQVVVQQQQKQECFSPVIIKKCDDASNLQQVVVKDRVQNFFSPVCNSKSDEGRNLSGKFNPQSCFSPPAIKQLGSVRNVFTPKSQHQCVVEGVGNRGLFTPAKTQEEELVEEIEADLKYRKMADNNFRAPPELVGKFDDFVHSVTKSGKMRVGKSQFEIFPVQEEPEEEEAELQKDEGHVQAGSSQSSKKRKLHVQHGSETKRSSKSLSKSRQQNDPLQASILDFYRPQSGQPSTSGSQQKKNQTPTNMLASNQQESIKIASLLTSPPKSNQQLLVPTPVSWPPSTTFPKLPQQNDTIQDQQPATCMETGDLFKNNNNQKNNFSTKDDIGSFSPLSGSLQISRLSEQGLKFDENGSRKRLVFDADLSSVKEDIPFIGKDVGRNSKCRVGKALFQNQLCMEDKTLQSNEGKQTLQNKVKSSDQIGGTDDLAGTTDEIAGSKSSDQQMGVVSKSFDKDCTVTATKASAQQESKPLQSSEQQQNKVNVSLCQTIGQQNNLASGVPKIKPTNYLGVGIEVATKGQTALLSQQKDTKGKRNNMVSGLRSFVQPKIDAQKPAAGGKPVLVPALEQAKKAKLQEEQKARRKLEDKSKRNQKAATDLPKKTGTKPKAVATGLRGRINNLAKQQSDQENEKGQNTGKGVLGSKYLPFSSKLNVAQPFCSSAKQNQQVQLQQQNQKIGAQKVIASATATTSAPAWTTDAEIDRYYCKPISKVNPYDIFATQSGAICQSIYTQVFPHLEYKQNKRDRESVEWHGDLFDANELERYQQYKGYISIDSKRQKTVFNNKQL